MAHNLRRRLEQYAANPRCEANLLSALTEVPMGAVAASVGLEAPFGQSPFALQRGVLFERALFEDGAALLRRALIERKALPANASGFLDLRLRSAGGPCASLEESAAAFETFLRSAAKSTGEARMQLPTLLAGPVLPMPEDVLGPGLLALDALTVHPQPRPAPITLRVGELKVYPDRGGFTDTTELATARAQAGLYVCGLELFVAKLGLGRDLLVAGDGFLVLSKPGTNAPSVRAGEELDYQAARAGELLERLRHRAKQGPSTATPESILQAATHYGDACLGFCELATRCRAEALAQGLPEALGEDLARLLGGLTLHRALELLRGAAASNAAETDFLRRAR